MNTLNLLTSMWANEAYPGQPFCSRVAKLERPT